MREAELRGRLVGHLGSAYSPVWSATFVISDLGHRTVDQALVDGVEAREVWRAAWAALELPESDR